MSARDTAKSVANAVVVTTLTSVILKTGPAAVQAVGRWSSNVWERAKTARMAAKIRAERNKRKLDGVIDGEIVDPDEDKDG